MGKNEVKRERVHDGHRERLKQRCLDEGLDSFADHQALELLLFYALPYRDTNELAHRLLQYFGSFSGVLDADYHELQRIKGVGKNTAMLICSMPEFFRRYQLDRQGPYAALKSLFDAGQYAIGLFIGAEYETFYLICMDAQNHVLKAALIAEGTLSEVPVYPRIAVETALRYRAHSVLLAHNHPSGAMQPSASDVSLTSSIIAALSTIDVKVLDHLIVNGSKYLSLAELGLMKSGFS